MNIITANRLMELRKAHGYSQEELAYALGITRQAISKWERAEASPDTDNLIALARLYNMKLDDLLEGEKLSDEELRSPLQERKEEENIEERKHDSFYPYFCGGISLLLLFAFILVGLFIPNAWSWSWIFLLFIPVCITFYLAIGSRNPNVFCYPLLILAIYCFLGIYFHYWHPYWCLFLSIPLYYLFASWLYEKIKRRKKS